MQNESSFGHYDRIVIHTPHAGTILPIYFRVIKHIDCVKINASCKKFILPYFKQLTDHYTDKLFGYVAQLPYNLKQDRFPFPKHIYQVSFSYSRLFCDVERLENDPLEEKGLGIHYDFAKITKKPSYFWWSLTKNDALRLYNEHQKKLSSIICPEVGMAVITSLILDCHSFSERDNVLCPNAHEFKDIDICLGFNEDETKPSDVFIESIKKFFTACGYKVAYNKPFSNSKTIQYDASQHLCKPNYHTIMIEVNKHCYMNEDTLEITGGFYKLNTELQQLYKLLLG